MNVRHCNNEPDFNLLINLRLQWIPRRYSYEMQESCSRDEAFKYEYVTRVNKATISTTH